MLVVEFVTVQTSGSEGLGVVLEEGVVEAVVGSAVVELDVGAEVVELDDVGAEVVVLNDVGADVVVVVIGLGVVFLFIFVSSGETKESNVSVALFVNDDLGSSETKEIHLIKHK